MIRTEETASDRARAAIDRDGRGEGAVLVTIADLKTLVMQADALRHTAPHAAQCIEMGPTPS